MGIEHSSTYPAFKALAERLTDAGCVTLRVDVYGTGDSPGRGDQITDLHPWRDAISRADHYLRKLGVQQIVLVGCRLSGTMVLEQAPALDAAGVVMIAPVISARRYVRQLRLLSRAAPGDGGGFTVGGTFFTAAFVDCLDHAELATTGAGTIATLVVTQQSGGQEAKFATSLSSATLLVEPNLATILDVPAEEASVHPALIDAISRWVLHKAPTTLPLTIELGSLDATAAPIPWRDGEVVERFVTVGPDQLAGVMTSSAQASGPTDEIVVFLNSGSDPHTGPARAWVEFARDLATPQRSLLRVDFLGWGDSPSARDNPGRPYDDSALGDTRRLVSWLHDQGWSRVVLAGLCAGAWIALQVGRAPDAGVDGVLALNPQMYWQPGDPVEALMTTTRARRLSEIEWIKRESDAGRWDAEDAEGARNPAAAWLDDLMLRDQPVSLVFSDGDDGIEYLRDRLSRRLVAATSTGSVRIAEVDDIDHGMQATWLRPSMLAVLENELTAMRSS
jgi:dienelactone hydrolase